MVNHNTAVNINYIVSIDFSENESGRQCMIKTSNGEVFMTDNDQHIDRIINEVILNG